MTGVQTCALPISDYYQERQLLVSDRAARAARVLGPSDLTAEDTAALRAAIAPEVEAQRVQVIQVYRVEPDAAPAVPVPLLEVAAPEVPATYSREAVDRLAAQVLAGSDETRSVDAFGTAGDLLHAAALIRSADGRVTGVVVATDYMDGIIAGRSRRMTEEFENYSQLRVFSRPLTGVYLLFFLMVTLMILVGSTWMGLYVAKRITRPVQLLANAAREIGAGHLDQRVEPQSDDEFGSLTEAFNAMAAELAGSRLRVEQTTAALEQRRRYVEAILERITTGVVSVNAAGAVATIKIGRAHV